MNRFLLGRKESYLSVSDTLKGQSWDLFISSYNLSERVRLVYDAVEASEKLWLVAVEYGLSEEEEPDEPCVRMNSRDEGEVIRTLLDGFETLSDLRICVDSTGFIRQHLLFLMRLLFSRGVRNLDVLYAEPDSYRDRERTTFSDGALFEVRQVMGYEGGQHESGQDVLVIGSGYDSRLISKVSESKSSCRTIQLVGLPSLRADMYQENMLKVVEAETYTGKTEFIYAPANDPFVTASVLKETIERIERVGPIGNLYLSPLGTKAQVLGFSLYYISEKIESNASIIFPISELYSKDTSVGVSRVWRYFLEF